MSGTKRKASPACSPQQHGQPVAARLIVADELGLLKGVLNDFRDCHN